MASTYGSYITLFCVLLIKYLRSEVTWRAIDILKNGTRIELRSSSKVNELDPSIAKPLTSLTVDDVLRLDIPVHDLILVHVVDS
jgi:hypothetical protein